MSLIFTSVTRMLCDHIYPDDSFEITEVSKERIYALLNRINVVFDGFSKGSRRISLRQTFFKLSLRSKSWRSITP